MNEQPKPCPFCGRDSAFLYGCVGGHFVKCISCSSRSAVYPLKSEAIAAWNRRAESIDYANAVVDNMAGAIELLTESRDALGVVVADLKAKTDRLEAELSKKHRRDE